MKVETLEDRPLTVLLLFPLISAISQKLNLTSNYLMPEKFIWTSESKTRYENVLQLKWFCEKFHSLADNLDKYSIENSFGQVRAKLDMKMYFSQNGSVKKIILLQITWTNIQLIKQWNKLLSI